MTRRRSAWLLAATALTMGLTVPAFADDDDDDDDDRGNRGSSSGLVCRGTIGARADRGALPARGGRADAGRDG